MIHLPKRKVNHAEPHLGIPRFRFGAPRSKIRDAAGEAQLLGCPVRAIVVGPADAPPSLEIYALGIKVTKPINPYEVKQATLRRLICDIHKEFYVKNRQHYLDIQNGKSFPQP
jgi:hypothetical protein